MAISKLTDDLNIISSLPDRPTLTSQELKEQFDKASNLIKKYINEKLTEEVATELETTINEAKKYVDSLSETLEETVNSKITELENSVNTSIEDIQTTVNTSISNLNTSVDKKTAYGDMTIEMHQVSWGGGQVYLGSSQTDASNTITKSGYYPIGVCSINTLSRDRDYKIIGHSKANGKITVNYRWYHPTDISIAPGDMPQSIICVAWVKIR